MWRGIATLDANNRWGGGGVIVDGLHGGMLVVRDAVAHHPRANQWTARCRASGRALRASSRLTCLAGPVLLGNARVEACTRLFVAQLPVDAAALVVTVPAYCAGAGPLRLVPALTRAIVLEAGVISAERAVGGGSGVSTEAVRACGAPCTAFWAYHATESKRRRSAITAAASPRPALREVASIDASTPCFPRSAARTYY